MKCIVALSIALLTTVSVSLAGEFESAEINTSLSFNQNDRISLGDAGNGGWYFTPHIGFNSISNTATQGFTIEFEEGITFGGGFGVELKPGLSFQFDFGYIENDVKHISNDGTGASASPDMEFTQIPLMFSLIWTPSNQPDVKPYFGLGAGAIRGKYETNIFINSDAEWALAAQARIGLILELSSKSNLSIGYKFTYARYDDNIDNHTIGIGLQFRF